MGLGRLLIGAGILLIIAGVLVTLGQRLPVRLGHLPGDIVYRGKNTTFYFPVVTCIILSILLTVILSLFGRR